MTIALWIISIVLIIFGVYVSVMNWAVFVYNHIVKKEWTSAIPLVGGVFCALGIALLPVTGSWKYAWIPFLADWGSVPVILTSLFFNVKQKGDLSDRS